uniref:Glycolipid transfer protein domain-containing protein n=1 Tax=Brassica oleracea var. oleracea TaxID=109376 RepID=A0A0D3AUL9_BRAOL
MHFVTNIELKRSDHSLRDATFTAYNQVFAPHHGWAIQQAVATGIGSLLPKTLLSGMFNETEETFKIHAQSYVTASASVTNYLDNLILSKNLGIDW